MRPIDKGGWPVNNGTRVTFKKHTEARPSLEHNTGRYCHFCEMPILNVPSVEHIKPKELRTNKTKYLHLRKHWDNLLLICHYCNRHKSDQDIKTYNYYWPHKHNTYKLYEYYSTPGLPSLRAGLSNIQGPKALSTVNLYGLTRMTDSTGGIDIRYAKRMDAFGMAISRLVEYTQIPKQTTIQGIVDNARSTGFWSVWYEVFSNEPAVLDALLNHDDFGHLKVFNCFPAPDFQPVDRNPHSQPDTI